MAINDLSVLLKERNLTQKDLAEILNTTPANLSIKLKNHSFKETEIIEILNILDFALKKEYIDKKTGKTVYRSEIGIF